MSVKIKINWDNENVVSESVRIYRADSKFTSNNLPPLLAEIVDDVYEYEDLTTVENQTYFYMLSCFLGEQEAFTECFEVLAQKQISYVRLSLTGGVYRNAGSGTTAVTNLQLYEPNGSSANNILIAVVSSFVTVTASAGWALLSNKNNVHVFWKKGTAQNASHIFTLASSSFAGGCMFLLQPSSAITTMECVSEMVSRSIASASTPAVSPVLTIPIDGNCFEIILCKINNLGGGDTDGSFSAGYQKIATQSYPSMINGTYQFNLLIGGSSKAKGSAIGGGSAFLTQGQYPNTLYTQTIQICAY